MAGKTDSTSAKQGNSAFKKLMQPDETLAAVIGSTPLPRTEVPGKIWDYIRAHKLQDPADKKTIRADDKLKAVFAGKASVTMFEMTKLVNAHLKEAK